MNSDFVKATDPHGHRGLYSTIGRRIDHSETWSRRICGQYYCFTLFRDEHRVEISKLMPMPKHQTWVVVHYIQFDYPEDSDG